MAKTSMKIKQQMAPKYSTRAYNRCKICGRPHYTFSITEKNSMDRLFGILPVRKSELVIGRYVFVLAKMCIRDRHLARYLAM